MSRTNSPWSMVGLLIGAPKLRSASRKKDKGKTDSETGKNKPPVQQYEGVADRKAEAAVEEVAGVEEPVMVAGAISRETHAPSVKESLTEEHLVARPGTLEEHDNGWTNVATQQQHSSASSIGFVDQLGASPNADEDMVDVLSQSVSVEFLNQQTQASSGGPYVASKLERKEADMAVLENEKKDLESRLMAVSDELAIVGRRNRESDDEKHRQELKINLMESAMRVLEGEIAEAKKSEQQTKGEVEVGLKRILALDEELHRQLEAVEKLELERQGQEEVQRKLEENAERNKELQERIRALQDDQCEQLEIFKGVKNNLQRERRGREDAQRQLDESVKRSYDLEERNRRLLEERQATEEELEGLRGRDVNVNNVLASALADLALAQQEREGAQGRLRESEKRGKELEERNRRLLEEGQAGKKELEGLWGLNTETANSLKAVLAELKAASYEKGELLNKVDRQAGELAEREQEIQGLKRSQAEIIKQPNLRQLDVLERRNRMLMDQLRHQSEQLRQKTLPRQDLVPQLLEPKGDISGAIAGMLNKLNSEVFQAAAHMADSLDFTSPMNMNSQELKAVVERASVAMGKPMAMVIQGSSAQPGVEFNTLPVQIGLQACIISCCAKIITSWCPGHWDYGDFLAAIYLRIIGTTPLNVAARWRTLTERQLKNPTDGTIQTEMEDYILRNLVDALVIAGWRKTQSNARDFLTNFRERLGQIVKLALRLNLALGDDWEVIAIHPNETFDADKMDDAYGEENEGGDQVVCTTELGVKMVGNVILKPKIVLRAMLTEETGYDAF